MPAIFASRKGSREITIGSMQFLGQNIRPQHHKRGARRAMRGDAHRGCTAVCPARHANLADFIEVEVVRRIESRENFRYFPAIARKPGTKMNLLCRNSISFDDRFGGLGEHEHG